MMTETINHFGISGGKDSTALLLWAVHESGYPHESLRVTFTDTGNEAPETYDYVRMLSEKVFPIEWIKPPLDFYELAQKKQRFPDPLRRFCTVELKLKPVKRYLDELMAEGFDILAHSGVRGSESESRSKLPEREWDTFFDCEVYRPLMKWTIDDVWAIHEKYSIPRNPLYAFAKRVGCFPCVMSRKEELLQISRRMPERIAFLRQKEKEISATSKTGLATFFGIGKVPENQASEHYTTKDGRHVKVANIDDVVRWAATDRGGQQYKLEFDDMDEPPVCASRYGACE